MPGGQCASAEAEKQLIILSVHSAEKKNYAGFLAIKEGVS